MNELQLQLQLKKYTIKSSLSGPPIPEEPFPSPCTFQPQPQISHLLRWYTSSHILKTSVQGRVYPSITASTSLTIAALLGLLLAGFTLIGLLAYSSPLPSLASLHNNSTVNLGDNSSAPVFSKSASTLHTHRASPGLLTIHTDPGMLSNHTRKSVSF